MASKNKNRRYETSQPVAIIKDKIPLVSVIIPMYNSAKFIPQTLESLLYQTMKDFEVVVVDDCSTDNSVEVVEGFKERFATGGGVKLSVIKLPKNTGTPCLPRNVGIQFARGKYLAFLDNDDFFFKTAFEELTTLAEENNADVINMTNVFGVKYDGFDLKELLKTVSRQIDNFRELRLPHLPKVTEVSEDLAKRLGLWLNNGFQWATWNSFCKRDFWVENQINFPFMPVSDDMVANFACLCRAKKIILVPNMLYIHRERSDSISQKNDDVEEFFHKWLRNLILGFQSVERIMSGMPFFDAHLDYRYAVLEWFFNRLIDDAKHFPAIYSQIHPALLDSLAEKEFHSDDVIFSAYLFNTVNLQRLQIMRLQQELAKFQKQ